MAPCCPQGWSVGLGVEVTARSSREGKGRAETQFWEGKRTLPKILISSWASREKVFFVFVFVLFHFFPSPYIPSMPSSTSTHPRTEFLCVCFDISHPQRQKKAPATVGDFKKGNLKFPNRVWAIAQPCWYCLEKYILWCGKCASIRLGLNTVCWIVQGTDPVFSILFLWEKMRPVKNELGVQAVFQMWQLVSK